MSSIKFKTADRNTLQIFPFSINDAIDKNHIVRFIAEILDQLDLSEFEAACSEMGRPSYDIKILLGILFYGYMTNTFSSRKLEKATYEVLPFMYLACGLHPDHSTIAVFRKTFLKEMDSVFYQILEIGSEMGIVRLKHASNDSSKILANASKHKALSWGYIVKREQTIREELDLLHELANNAEQAPIDMNIPEEIERRDSLLAAIGSAKKVIEARAQERYDSEKEEYDEKVKKRVAYEKRTGKKMGGRKPIVPIHGPKKKDQVNLTDPESRIMPKSGGGFVQAFNSHITVDVESRIILAKHVTQSTNDKLEMEPTVKEVQKVERLLSGSLEALLSDAGFHSADNVLLCKEANIQPLIPNNRERHHKSLLSRFEHADPNEIPEDDDPVAHMKYLLQTKNGKELYRLRKSTVETAFGCMKHTMGFRQFSLRGLEKVKGEWTIACIAYNLKKMHILSSTQNTNTQNDPRNVSQQPKLENAAIESPIRVISRFLCFFTQEIIIFFAVKFGQGSEENNGFDCEAILNLA